MARTHKHPTRRPPKRAVLAVLIFASIATTLVGPRLAGVLRAGTRWILAPLGDGGMLVQTTLRSRAAKMAAKPLDGEAARELREENRRLRAAIKTFGARVRRENRLRAGRQKLFGRLDLLEFECDLIPARIVGTGSLPYGQGRVLSAGGSRGVEPGQRITTRRVLTDRAKALPVPPKLAALSTEALVGWVTDSWALGAEVQLVTDPGFRVHGYIRRDFDPNRPRKVTLLTEGAAAEAILTPENNRLIPVLAEGDGAGRLSVPDVPAGHNVLPGDELVTRGDNLYLPERLLVGRVESVTAQRKNPGFVTLSVAPEVDLEALRDVYIVIPSARPAGQAGG